MRMNGTSLGEVISKCFGRTRFINLLTYIKIELSRDRTYLERKVV